MFRFFFFLIIGQYLKIGRHHNFLNELEDLVTVGLSCLEAIIWSWVTGYSFSYGSYYLTHLSSLTPCCLTCCWFHSDIFLGLVGICICNAWMSRFYKAYQGGTRTSETKIIRDEFWCKVRKYPQSGLLKCRMSYLEILWSFINSQPPPLGFPPFPFFPPSFASCLPFLLLPSKSFP